MAFCLSKLTANLERDCVKPLAQGVKELAFIGMFEDVAAVAYDATNGKIVTGITLKSGTKLFKIEGVNYSNKPTLGFAENDYGITVPHVFDFAVVSNGAGVKANIDTMFGRKDFFVIYKREGQFGEHEIMGLDTGMRVTTFSQNPDDANQKGAYILQLTASGETKTPYTLLHKTSTLEDTPAYLTTLLVAAT